MQDLIAPNLPLLHLDKVFPSMLMSPIYWYSIPTHLSKTIRCIYLEKSYCRTRLPASLHWFSLRRQLTKPSSLTQLQRPVTKRRTLAPLWETEERCSFPNCSIVSGSEGRRTAVCFRTRSETVFHSQDNDNQSWLYKCDSDQRRFPHYRSF